MVIGFVCLLFIKRFVDSKKPQYVAQTSGCSEGVFVLVFGGCMFVVLVLGFFYLSFCSLWTKQFNRESSFGEVFKRYRCFMMESVML